MEMIQMIMKDNKDIPVDSHFSFNRDNHSFSNRVVNRFSRAESRSRVRVVITNSISGFRW